MKKFLYCIALGAISGCSFIREKQTEMVQEQVQEKFDSTITGIESYVLGLIFWIILIFVAFFLGRRILKILLRRNE